MSEQLDGIFKGYPDLSQYCVRKSRSPTDSVGYDKVNSLIKAILGIIHLGIIHLVRSQNFPKN